MEAFALALNESIDRLRISPEIISKRKGTEHLLRPETSLLFNLLRDSPGFMNLLLHPT